MKKDNNRKINPMAQVVVIYGPPGTGKTLNAEALKTYFGCVTIRDEANGYGGDLLAGVLALTNIDPMEERPARRGRQRRRSEADKTRAHLIAADDGDGGSMLVGMACDLTFEPMVKQVFWVGIKAALAWLKQEGVQVLTERPKAAALKFRALTREQGPFPVGISTAGLLDLMRLAEGVAPVA